MYPVFEHNGDHSVGCDFAEFRDRFANICQEHRDERRAMLFAFILHDKRHPYQRKVLDDSDYWTALHVTSGNKITIFSFVPNRKTSIRRRPKSNTVELMVRIDVFEDDDPYASFNKKFNLHGDQMLPGMVFFQVHENEVIDSIFVPLIAKGEEEAFNEIEDVIKTVLNSISSVLEKNYKNGQEIFNLAENALKDRKTFGLIRRGIRGVLNIKDFLNLFNFAA